MNSSALQIPVMPNAVFYALRRGVADAALAGNWHIDNGKNVVEGQKIITFGRWSERMSLFKHVEHSIDVVAPVSGKVFFKDYITYEHWDKKELWPKYTSVNNDLFVIQTTMQIDVSNEVRNAYSSLIKYITALMDGTSGKGLNNRNDVEQYRKAILDELEWLKLAKARKIGFKEWEKL